MGHENVGATLRDRVAEIVSDARRPSQTTGNVTESDYATADEIIAVVRRDDAHTSVHVNPATTATTVKTKAKNG